ncbi:hypothetical protein ABPG72_006408 [Tetrahymena utriculariae]
MKDGLKAFNKYNPFFETDKVVTQLKEQLEYMGQLNNNEQQYIPIINKLKNQNKQNKKLIKQKFKKQITEQELIIQNLQYQNQQYEQNFQDQKITLKKEIIELISQNKNLIFDNQLSKQLLREKEKEIEQQKNQITLLKQDLENMKSTQNEQQAIIKIFKKLTIDQNYAGNIDQQIQQILAQLNPQIQIQYNIVQFTKAHQIINQNQPTEQEKFKNKEWQISVIL